MVDGACKAPDQAALLQRRQRIARDRILRMKQVELPIGRQLEVPDVIAIRVCTMSATFLLAGEAMTAIAGDSGARKNPLPPASGA